MKRKIFTRILAWIGLLAVTSALASLGFGQNSTPSGSVPAPETRSHPSHVTTERSGQMVINSLYDYVIQPGDTLAAVAKACRVPVSLILNVNPGLDSQHLKVGGILKIPNLVGRTKRHTATRVQSELQDLVGRLRNAKTDQERKSLEADLKSRLDQYFEADMKRREQQLASIQERVGKLQNLLKKRKASKAEILDLQYKLQVNEAQGLGLFSEEELNGLLNPTSKQVSPLLVPSRYRQLTPEVARQFDIRREPLVPGSPPERGPRSTANPTTKATPVNWQSKPLLHNLSQLNLALRIYATSHNESFPETLKGLSSILGDPGLLRRILTYPSAVALIYIYAPGQVTETYPTRPTLIVPAKSRGAYVGFGDGSVQRSLKSTEELLRQECSEIAKEQPGTSAIVSVGPGIGAAQQRMLHGVFQETGIRLLRTEKLPQTNRIRIHLIPPPPSRTKQ